MRDKPPHILTPAVAELDLDAIEKWLETSGFSGLGGRVGALVHYIRQRVAALRQAQQQMEDRAEKLAEEWAAHAINEEHERSLALQQEYLGIMEQVQYDPTTPNNPNYRHPFDDPNTLVSQLQAADTLAYMERVLTAVLEAIYVDPHQWSNRSCPTCRTVTAIWGKDFGCVRYAEEHQR